MVYRHVDKALRAEVFEAVQRAVASGSKESKVSIMSKFLDRGVSRASLYAWVSRDMEDIAAGLVVHIPPLDVEPIAVRVGSMVEQGHAALASQPAGGIAYEQRLNNTLRRGDVMRAMAYGPDGRVRNIRLIRDTDEQERKVLQTAAIIQEKISATQREMHAKFIDELLDLVMAELPAKRDQILRRIDEVRMRYGTSV